MSQEETAAARPFWASNIIHTCMNVKHSEKLLIVTDEPLAYVRDALLAEAPTADPGEIWSYTITNNTRPLASLPARLVAMAKEVDVIIVLLETLHSEELSSPTLLSDLITMYTSGARVAVGGFISPDILEHELSADYQHVADLSSALAARLQGTSSVHVTTPLGTDLRLSVTDRTWHSDTGLFRGPGWGNIPAGEVFVAPVEESAEGVLVIDKSLPGLALSEPVRIVFEGGRAVSIEGGAGATYLEQAFNSIDGQPHSEWARVIGEFGIGTNPKARLLGNIMTDEKVLGTVHIALGRNDMWGGHNSAPLHLDGVVSQPTVRVDGELLIDNGKHVLHS